ncbi:MAG: VCBS repeat-containing protein [Chlorobi bacterium]|nr:VCBS repeat-containing protein [Chlorobiota bacterium]
MLKSCLFLNNGDGTFETAELPKMAQFSPVRDILVRDFDLDGMMDLVLVGNDYAVRPSFGRYDASYGWCLLGGKAHEYNVLMPVGSGLVIKGDARRVRTIEVMGKHYIVVAVNNGGLQFFQLLRQAATSQAD